MINGVEEALILLFAAIRYEYLFWSIVVRVWIVRLFIREKILIVEETNDKKKEEVKPKTSGEKNVSTNIFRVLRCDETETRGEVLRFELVRRKKEEGRQTKNIWLSHKKKYFERTV